jgi:hypothetical protein
MDEIKKQIEKKAREYTKHKRCPECAEYGFYAGLMYALYLIGNGVVLDYDNLKSEYGNILNTPD